MKAWVLEKQEKIEEKPLCQREISIPSPQKNEIRIRIKATGICRTDLHIIEGDLPLHKKPVIPGHQIVGIVEELGEDITSFKIGDKVGVAWLYRACGECEFCRKGIENLCEKAKFTGWDVDGGFTEAIVINENFAFHLGEKHSFAEQVPFMCAGITGYRGYRLAEIKKGEKLGLFGFGPTAFYVLQIANSEDIECFVVTRSKRNQEFAKKLKASWVGSYEDKLPIELDAAILYPPNGELVSYVLSMLKPGGRLILSPIYMSKIEIKDYPNLLWREKSIKSIANITRKDGIEFLKIADELNLNSRIELYGFNEIPKALLKLKRGEVEGTPVVSFE
ncbi:MAG: zinc-dependent alcohol dehydrogenase family protein [candidate division WOR-3 bacterium]